MSESRSALQAMADAFWDLRDHTYDHPDRWHSVTAEECFQVIAKELELVGEEGKAIDWVSFPHSVTATLVEEGSSSADGE